MIGLTLNDRYQIKSEIGRGGMGAVYLAHDLMLDRDVAVKVLTGAKIGSEGRARLLQEAQVAASLNHPNIVSVYDVGTFHVQIPPENISYIVMEYVEGQPLANYTAESMDEVLAIAQQICRALEDAHDKGIIHRDLKPDNVILTQAKAVKLMDFGLARMSGRARITEEGTLMGTLSFLAPEIILGQEATVQSDLYALGVMLYELAAGRLPFEGDTPTAVLGQHLHAPVVPPSRYNEAIPPLLERLIAQLLAKRPEERPRSAAEVRQSLALVLSQTAEEQIIEPRSQLARLVRGRLVGREKELEQAINTWRQAENGRGQVLLVSGEPGIGKTRFVKEFAAFVEFSGGILLEGACYEGEGLPYSPIAQMIRRSLDDEMAAGLPETVAAGLISLAPKLKSTVAVAAGEQELEPEMQQQRLFESVIAWLRLLTARPSAVLLFLDDIHWADSGTAALLQYLARRMAQMPLLIVATYREVELDESKPLRQTLVMLHRERLAVRIKLTRLTKQYTNAMLAIIFDEEITPDFLEAIYRETEGNPFFIEEVCKVLVDNGTLRYENGHWQRPELVDFEIPQGVRVAIQSRLARLEKQDLELLQVAAVLGRDFEFEMLAAVTSSDYGPAIDEESQIEALERAESAQLIAELRKNGRSPALAFSFTHALIHTTLLSDLSTLRRQRLQRSVALALEESFPNRASELAPLLGRYFAEAGDDEKAIRYLLQTGDQARDLFAYSEAAKAYEQALIFLREGKEVDLTARTLMKLGLTYHNAFDFDNARLAYEEGFALWQLATTGPGTPTADLPPAPHPFRVLIPEPVTLDPASAHETSSIPIINQLFSALVTPSPEGDLIPDIARSWELLDYGRRYLFYLRDDARWSDGRPVTAHDFHFSYLRILDPANGPRPANLFYDIVGAEAFNKGEITNPDLVGLRVVDDWTLEIRLEGATSYFLQLMAMAFPVPEHKVRALGKSWTEPDKIVTNGPFLLTDWQPEQLLVLTKNPDYHGRFRGNIEQVEAYLLDGEELIPWYEEDRLDYANFFQMSPREAVRARNKFASDHLSIPGLSTMFLAFDTRRPPFDKREVRQAFVLAFDGETFNQVINRGFGSVADGGIVPPGIPGHIKGIGYAYDITKARELLAQVGYTASRGLPSIDFTSIISSDDPNDPVVWLKDQWQQHLNVSISLQNTNLTEIYEHLMHDTPHMWASGWIADYPDPDNFLRLGDWLPISGWYNETYFRLVEEARRVADLEKRMAMYRQAEMILVDEVPVIPLGYGRYHFFVKPWVKQFKISALLNAFYQDIILEPHD